MARIHASVLSLIGDTPIVRLARMAPRGLEVCVKLESLNPGGSVKDRAALRMLDDAIARGELDAEGTILEATSGNTGIALAMIAAVRGAKCVLVMPEDMSHARRQMLLAYGAEVVLTPSDQGMAGAVQHASAMRDELRAAGRKVFVPSQFANPSNADAHAMTTAEEIWDATDGDLDAFVAGVGTGGTITGVARVLKTRRPSIHIVAVEPRQSAVLSGGAPGLHGIQGIGAGFIPEVLDRSLVDEVVTVSDVAADRAQRRLAREEGLFVGPSAGANVHAALEVASKLGPGRRIVTIACDGGARYLR